MAAKKSKKKVTKKKARRSAPPMQGQTSGDSSPNPNQWRQKGRPWEDPRLLPDWRFPLPPTGPFPGMLPMPPGSKPPPGGKPGPFGKPIWERPGFLYRDPGDYYPPYPPPIGAATEAPRTKKKVTKKRASAKGKAKAKGSSRGRGRSSGRSRSRGGR